MTTVLLFGGQGSQYPGMLRQWSHVPQVAENIETASRLLKEDVIAYDSAEAMAGTRAVQLSLLILQTGVARALRETAENEGLQPGIGAGHSLGAWSAAVSAGVLAFDDAVRLVDLRATAMADSAPEGYGMAAVIGLREQGVTRLVDEVRAAGEDAWLSNLNSATQFTVSGSERALEILEISAARSGAQRVVRLGVAVPAHSPMMTCARRSLESAALSVRPGKPQFPVLGNSTGRLLRTSGPILKDLVESTDQPVRWGAGVSAIAERGVRRWIQISPGNSLIGLLHGLDDGARSWCVDNVGLSETVARWRTA